MMTDDDFQTMRRSSADPSKLNRSTVTEHQTVSEFVDFNYCSEGQTSWTFFWL